MNWTGGNLSRSRHANASITAKQKSHFAKVRAKLQNARCHTPTKTTSRSGRWQPDYETRNSESTPSTSIKQYGNLREQTALDEFENMRPLIRRLESLKPRNNKRKYASIKQEQPNPPTRLESPHKTRSRSPLIISSQALSSSSSPLSLQEATTNQVRSVSSSGAPEDGDIEAKRRRLLQMQDWVGVECKHSEPVHMQFTDTKDKDMIGKRRQLNNTPLHLQSIHTKQPLLMKKYIDGRRGLTSPERHFSEGPMSIRIGSAAGKSSHMEVSDEMLLDSEVDKPGERVSPAVPTMRAGELTSSTVPDHGQREILTPSAYMEHVSSSSSAFPSLPHESPYESQQTVYLVDDEAPLESGSETGEPGIELIYEKPEQELEEPGFRLVLEDTPRDYPQVFGTRLNSPVFHDFDLTRAQVGELSRKKSGVSKYHNSKTIDTHYATRDLCSNGLAHSTSPFAILMSQNTTELQHHELKIGGDHRAIGYGFRNVVAEPESHTENNMKSTTLQTPPIIKSPIVSTYSNSGPHSEEESMWRNLVVLEGVEDQSAEKGRPFSHETSEYPATEVAYKHAASPAQPQDVGPEAAENEAEQIWRKFIFGDDDRDDSWTVEEFATQIDKHSTFDPVSTLPSMIAEVATSPIKQNPHMETIEPSSDESIFSPDKPSHNVGAAFSTPDERSFTASSDLVEVLSDIQDSIEFATISTSPPEASDVESLVVEASPAKTHVSAAPSPNTAVHNDTRTTQTSSLAQKLPPRQHNPPSLLAEASSGPLQASSNAANISSDELQWSPVRAPPITSRTIEPKVVFRPPQRYVGERGAGASEIVTLGRVLRNGKRVNSRFEKKGRKGRIGASPEVEDDTDEIEDD